MTIKIRTKLKGERVELKSLIKHPMETGLRKDSKTGAVIPARFVTEVTIRKNGKTVSVGQLSPGVSRNPFVGLKFKGKKGDVIELSYVDNTGETGTARSVV